MYGDTAVGRKRVAQLREQSGDIQALAARLVSQSEAVPWHGKAAEAMRARIKERANHLRTAAAQHELAAESLARHLNEVDIAKDSIESRSHKATTLIEDARTRAGQVGPGEAGSPPQDDDTDAALLTFDPPPAGHKDWLTANLPGL